MSRYYRNSPKPTFLGSLIAVAAIATLSFWLPAWISFCQWVATLAFSLGALLWS